MHVCTYVHPFSPQPDALNATEMTVTLADGQARKGVSLIPVGSRLRPREDLRLSLRK